jgi:hypothetical protein
MTLPIIGSFADGAITGAPQRGQKRASSGVAAPHCVQCLMLRKA